MTEKDYDLTQDEIDHIEDAAERDAWEKANA